MPLKRAKQACVHCHGRRIRCDVLQQRPCSNCLAQEVPCEVGVSRRGKYPRRKTLKTDTQAQSGPQGVTESIPLSSLPPIQGKRNESTVFLGESSPLTSVMDPSKPPSLHYALPDRIAPSSLKETDDAVRLHQVQQAAQLETTGSLSFPPANTVDALLDAYFTWFHPCFPIVEKSTIFQLKNQNALPPLLLQAMLFIGVSLCSDTTFSSLRKEFPVPVRYRAKFLFYSRAKSIYDADAESNPIVKLQALFMLSFWRGGPSEERDVRYWLGIAVSLAQKRGMHMMSKFSPPPKEKRLWKRIWWALYTRDQQSAAALGLPPRIRDEDGDVAMLEPQDILEEPAEGASRQTAQELVYPVEMAKLARLLRTIVSTQYLHHQRPDLATRNALNEQLLVWESNLPAELRLENSSPDTLFLTGLLHMTYQNLYILLHRRTFLDPSPSPTDAETDTGQIALDAATKSTRIMEDLLSHHLVQHAPPHLITHAFSTLCIHTIHHRRSCGTMRTLAEHRARLCLLALEELQKSWDLENWVLHLFLKGLDDRTAAVLGLGSNERGQSNENVPAGANTGAGGAHPNVSAGSDVTGHVSGVGNDVSSGSGVNETLMPMPISLAQDDFYGWVPWEDEADALNLQNLEFLYRFL